MDQIRRIQSGEAKQLTAWGARVILRVASVFYGLAVRVRNWQFDSGRRETVKADVPVVCIGNLTTGGTGKTPVVCHLAQWLRQNGLRVAIVSRGYGSGESGVNDEALEMSVRLPDVPQVQDADRVEAARVAVEELESQVVLMDDGYQHRRLGRDYNIAVVDATCPFGYGYLLPRGLLREPVSALRRAEAVIVTRTDSVSAQEVDQTISVICKNVKADTPVVRSTHRPTDLLVFPDQAVSFDKIQGKKVVAVCGIGNPSAFRATLESCGATVHDLVEFSDHSEFGPSEVRGLMEYAQTHASEFDAFVCTHKDLVKLQTDRLGGKTLYALRIELSFVDSPQPIYDGIGGLLA